MPPNDAEGLSPEVRAVIALVALDVLIGTWVSLHAERAMSAFLAHVPALGLAGVAWGFLPSEAKSGTGAVLARGLRHRRALALLGGAATLFVAMTFARSTVEVEAVDGDAAARLHLVAGDVRAPGQVPSEIDEHRLNRLTTPVRFGVWITPFGRDVWLYSADRVSRAVRVWPWLPARLQYPDDFDALVTLAALPSPEALGAIAEGADAPVLTVRADDARGDVLGETALAGGRGVLFGYPAPASPSAADVARWRQLVDPIFAAADSDRVANIDAAIAGFARAPGLVRVRVVRPLRAGDRVFWQVSAQGKVLGSDTLRLTDAVSTTLLRF